MQHLHIAEPSVLFSLKIYFILKAESENVKDVELVCLSNIYDAKRGVCRHAVGFVIIITLEIFVYVDMLCIITIITFLVNYCLFINLLKIANYSTVRDR